MNLYEKSLNLEQHLSNSTLALPDHIVSQNSKTGQSFRSLLRFCSHRTHLCSQRCYACRGPISWAASVSKAIAVRRWIEQNGIEVSAKRMATEIYYGGIFRWMDRGDFDPLTVLLANRVVELRPDVSYCAFSRNLDALKSLNPKINKVYSVDNRSLGTIHQVPNSIKIAFMKTDTCTPIPKVVKIVFPINHRKNLLGSSIDCSFFKDKRVKCAGCRRCY
ncbi:MAG: hypothetical protein HUU50_04240 [Candidatus Brocadiae bacterium]|nr:hypothetical protein [Candidatus Brocadiia bacterium]